MQWHRNVEIKGKTIANVRYEKHYYENEIFVEIDMEWLCAKFRCENEAFQCNYGKLGTCD